MSTMYYRSSGFSVVGLIVAVNVDDSGLWVGFEKHYHLIFTTYLFSLLLLKNTAI